MFSTYLAFLFTLACGQHQAPIVVTDEEAVVQKLQWQRIHESLDSRKKTPSTCTNDMRSKMPACHQSQIVWCWATAIAELTEYYTGQGPSQCKGLECSIVGWSASVLPPSFGNFTHCCPARQHNPCEWVSASVQGIVNATNHWTRRLHRSFNGPMPQATLDKTLASGIPIIMIISRDGQERGSHAVTVAGCGNGVYYYHNPMWEAGVYKSYSYDELIQMPSSTGAPPYKWFDTVAAVFDNSNVAV